MTHVFVISAVLGAALLHAVWNTAVKSYDDKFVMMLTIGVVQALIAIIMVPFLGFPVKEAWPWLIVAAIPHTTYKIALAKAYETGDMTRIYPISRGLNIVLVTVISLFVLEESVSVLGLAAIAVISFGVFGLSSKEKTNVRGLSKVAMVLCVSAGISVAFYTILDGIGVRIGENSRDIIHIATFAAWLFILDGFGIIVFALLHRGKKVFIGVVETGVVGIFAGCTAFACFWIAIWAFAYAPISLVAAVRETSVLFSLILGKLFLRESVSRKRVIFACTVLVGIVMLRFS